jgi:hypothetical protein
MLAARRRYESGSQEIVVTTGSTIDDIEAEKSSYFVPFWSTDILI